ncbi:MAG: hypothetical protein WCV56_01800 [Candidatus Omnitrophota bacterium]
MRKIIGSAVLLAAACMFIAGCGNTASETKPIAEVQSEAKTMTGPQLEKMVNTYKAALETKEVQLKALQEKIKKIPVTQLLGDEARAIKEDVSKLAGSAQALTERMNIYLRELQAKQK